MKPHIVTFGDQQYRIFTSTGGFVFRAEVRIWRYNNTEDYWRRVALDGKKAQRVLKAHGFRTYPRLEQGNEPGQF